MNLQINKYSRKNKPCFPVSSKKKDSCLILSKTEKKESKN